jgi:hypothetical protein
LIGIVAHPESGGKLKCLERLVERRGGRELHRQSAGGLHGLWLGWGWPWITCRDRP